MRSLFLTCAILALSVATAPAASLFDKAVNGSQKAPVEQQYRGTDLSAPRTQQARPGNRRQQHPLHGNVESKVYHAADCEYYNCKSCTKEFATARQAEAEGYHACKICDGKEGTVTQRKAAGAAYKFHGNPTSKVVHGPSCKYFNSKSSSEFFTSMDQAKRQGYKPCTVCGGK